MPQDMTVAKNLRRIMIDKGISQEELSRRSGIPQGTLSMWMNGKRIPRMPNIDALAEHLGVTREDIVGKELKEPTLPYYLNEETAKIAQEAYDNPELRLLFDASRNAKPEDIRFAIEMLEKFKRGNPDG